MLPVYFLSVLFNGLAGGILAFGKVETETEGGGFSFSLNNETIRLGIGVITFITGILKILSPVGGNIPVAGDLFPALAGLAGGFIMAFDFYRRHNTIDALSVEKLADFVDKNRKTLGFVCITAAALHFIFYPVIFL